MYVFMFHSVPGQPNPNPTLARSLHQHATIAPLQMTAAEAEYGVDEAPRALRYLSKVNLPIAVH